MSSPSISQIHAIVWIRVKSIFFLHLATPLDCVAVVSSTPLVMVHAMDLHHCPLSSPRLAHHCVNGWSGGTECAELSSGAMVFSESHGNVAEALPVTLLSFIRASSPATLCYHPLTQLSDYQSFLLFPLILLFFFFLEQSFLFPIVYAFDFSYKCSLPINRLLLFPFFPIWSFLFPLFSSQKTATCFLGSVGPYYSQSPLL